MCCFISRGRARSVGVVWELRAVGVLMLMPDIAVVFKLVRSIADM